MTTCHVTLFNRPTIHPRGQKGGREYPKCGRPEVKYGLCTKHYERRVRCGGAA